MGIRAKLIDVCWKILIICGSKQEDWRVIWIVKEAKLIKMWADALYFGR